jgi:hypothetical protein
VSLQPGSRLGAYEIDVGRAQVHAGEPDVDFLLMEGSASESNSELEHEPRTMNREA